MLPLVSLPQLGLALLHLLSLVHAGDVVSYDLNTYGANSQSPYQSFVSAPDLKPPELLFTKNEPGIADGYLFIGVNGKPDSTQNVPSIYGRYLAPDPKDSQELMTDSVLQTCRLGQDWAPWSGLASSTRNHSTSKYKRTRDNPI